MNYLGYYRNGMEMETQMPWDSITYQSIPLTTNKVINQTDKIEIVKKAESIVNPPYCYGIAECEICNYNTVVRDFVLGNYQWSSIYLHYVETHNVVIDEELVAICI